MADKIKKTQSDQLGLNIISEIHKTFMILTNVLSKGSDPKVEKKILSTQFDDYEGFFKDKLVTLNEQVNYLKNTGNLDLLTENIEKFNEKEQKYPKNLLNCLFLNMIKYSQEFKEKEMEIINKELEKIPENELEKLSNKDLNLLKEKILNEELTKINGLNSHINKKAALSLIYNSVVMIIETNVDLTKGMRKLWAFDAKYSKDTINKWNSNLSIPASLFSLLTGKIVEEIKGETKSLEYTDAKVLNSLKEFLTPKFNPFEKENGFLKRNLVIDLLQEMYSENKIEFTEKEEIKLSKVPTDFDMDLILQNHTSEILKYSAIKGDKYKFVPEYFSNSTAPARTIFSGQISEYLLNNFLETIDKNKDLQLALGLGDKNKNGILNDDNLNEIIESDKKVKSIENTVQNKEEQIIVGKH